MFRGRSGSKALGVPAPGTIETLIGAGCNIHGELKATGSLRIDGAFEGTLNVEGDVIIGQNGRVSANTRARNLVVAGELHGDVEVENRLELQPTGKLFGKAQMAVVVLEEGAILEGECRMLETPSGRIAEAVASPPPSRKQDSGPRSTEEKDGNSVQAGAVNPSAGGSTPE